MRERGARGLAADRRRARRGRSSAVPRELIRRRIEISGDTRGRGSGRRARGRPQPRHAGGDPTEAPRDHDDDVKRTRDRPSAARGAGHRAARRRHGGRGGWMEIRAAETIIISPEPCGRRRERGRWPCGRRRPGPSCRSGSRRGPRRRRRAWRRKTWFAATPVGRSVQRSVEYDLESRFHSHKGVTCVLKIFTTNSIIRDPPFWWPSPAQANS